MFGLRYAGRYLQLSYVTPTEVCSAKAGRQVISTTLATPQSKLWDSVQEQRTNAYQQSVSLYCATNTISQLVFAFTAMNCNEFSYLNDKSEEQIKNLKNQPRRLFRPIAIHRYQKYIKPSGDPVPLRIHICRSTDKDHRATHQPGSLKVALFSSSVPKIF